MRRKQGRHNQADSYRLQVIDAQLQHAEKLFQPLSNRHLQEAIETESLEEFEPMSMLLSINSETSNSSEAKRNKNSVYKSKPKTEMRGVSMPRHSTTSLCIPAEVDTSRRKSTFNTNLNKAGCRAANHRDDPHSGRITFSIYLCQLLSYYPSVSNLL